MTRYGADHSGEIEGEGRYMLHCDRVVLDSGCVYMGIREGFEGAVKGKAPRCPFRVPREGEPLDFSR